MPQRQFEGSGVVPAARIEPAARGFHNRHQAQFVCPRITPILAEVCGKRPLVQESGKPRERRRF